MVGIVIVSNGKKAAQGVAELCKQMAAAMGMDLDMVLQRAPCPSCNKYA